MPDFAAPVDAADTARTGVVTVPLLDQLEGLPVQVRLAVKTHPRQSTLGLELPLQPVERPQLLGTVGTSDHGATGWQSRSRSHRTCTMQLRHDAAESERSTLRRSYLPSHEPEIERGLTWAGAGLPYRSHEVERRTPVMD